MSRTLPRILAALVVACGIVACTPAAAGAPESATPNTTAEPVRVPVVLHPDTEPRFSVDQALSTAAARIEVATQMHQAVEAELLERRLAEIAAEKAEALRRLERLQSVPAARIPTTTATSAPAATVATDPGSVEGIIRAAAAEFGIDGQRMLRIARCESSLNPAAVSSSGTYGGLFQHHKGYWPGRAAGLGYGPEHWLDATANARVSAQMMAGGGWGHWSCK